LRLLRGGGHLVYSTCSFSARQNEDVLAWLLLHLHYNQVPDDLEDTSQWQRLQSSDIRLVPLDDTDRVRFSMLRRGDSSNCEDASLSIEPARDLLKQFGRERVEQTYRSITQHSLRIYGEYAKSSEEEQSFWMSGLFIVKLGKYSRVSTTINGV
jgi:hypothetical protein